MGIGLAAKLNDMPEGFTVAGVEPATLHSRAALQPEVTIHYATSPRTSGPAGTNALGLTFQEVTQHNATRNLNQPSFGFKMSSIFTSSSHWPMKNRSGQPVMRPNRIGSFTLMM